jgi:hypothetical protein
VAKYGRRRAAAVTTIEVMDSSANTSSDCAYADSWHEEMRRAFDQRDALAQAACEALVRVLENFLAEEAVDDAHLDEVRRTIALIREPTDCARGSRTGGARLRERVERAMRGRRTPAPSGLLWPHRGESRAATAPGGEPNA